MRKRRIIAIRNKRGKIKLERRKEREKRVKEG